MLSDNITVKSVANANVVYDLISQNGSETRRIDAASTKAEPTTVRIASQNTGTGINQRTRTTTQLNRRKAVTGGYSDLSVNLTVNQPADGAFATADILEALTRLLGFLAASGDAHAALDATLVNRVFTLGEG